MAEGTTAVRRQTDERQARREEEGGASGGRRATPNAGLYVYPATRFAGLAATTSP